MLYIVVASDSEVPTTGGVKLALVVMRRIAISLRRWSLNSVYNSRDVGEGELHAWHYLVDICQASQV